jgi:hypothetical protein
MTPSEADLTNRLLMISSISSLIEFLKVLLVVYSKWNIKWSAKSTFKFFDMLEQLFGNPGLFTYTHRIFSESTVALASYYNPPSCPVDNPDGPLQECSFSDAADHYTAKRPSYMQLV